MIAVGTSAPDAGVSDDAPWASCRRYSVLDDISQRFTLALQDGGTVEIGYGAPGVATPPSLAAWIGKSVTVDAVPYFNGGYMAGASLMVTDSKGLVLASHYSMGALTSETVGSSGITISAGQATCLGGCGHLQKEIVFTGTTTVSLLPKISGSFKVGSLSFTGLSMGYSERQPDSNCADGASSSSWAIWRDAP